jgi:DNA-directed RNA polymerase subunit M/transcription elongation factor TFIIS
MNSLLPKQSERLLIIDRLKTACSHHDKWEDNDESMKKIIRMERSCFNKAINYCEVNKKPKQFDCVEFVSIYSSICYHIISNLDVNSTVCSDYLINKIIDGELDAFKISDCTSYELCPSASQKEKNEIAIKSEQKIEKKFSILYTCKACGHSKTQLDEHQTRSADELPTITAECLNCPNKWRIQ